MRESAAFTAADEVRFLDEFSAALAPDDHRARLDHLAWRGLAAEAQRTSPLVDEGYRELIGARLSLRGGQADTAARLAAVPERLRRDPGLLYERVRARRRDGDTAGAARLLLEPPDALGQPRRWWNERRRAYRGALDDGDARLAYRLAAGHRQTGGIGFSDSEWHAGWIALRFLDLPADARSHFERMWARVDTPISRARAAYWTGRAAAAAGDMRDAQHWYEVAAEFGTAFYGQEAARELGRRQLRLGAPLPSADPAGLRAGELARLASMLAQANDTSFLPTFSRALVRDAEGAGAIGDAIRYAQELGRWDAAIGGYIPLYRAGVLSAEASHPVPPSFRGLLRPADGDVTPARALAIARQESRFVLDAVSPAGARGLMQLMPATARLVAKDLGVPADIGRLTRDADYNAKLGTRYLGDLLRRFDDPALAAAGYNAGPGRSVAWVERFGDPRARDVHGYIDWLESIPFGETRNYVQRVLEGDRVYSALLAGG